MFDLYFLVGIHIFSYMTTTTTLFTPRPLVHSSRLAKTLLEGSSRGEADLTVAPVGHF